jgi:reactive intermediate/imine deaminase
MKWYRFLPLCLILIFGACSEGDYDDDRLVIEYPAEGMQGYPFSDAVRVGNMLYLSGAIGSLPEGQGIAEGGIQAEARQTMENIKATLEKYGSSMEEIVKCTVMLADMSEWGALNEVYVTYFPGHKPARSAFGATDLALGASVEIECIATVQPQKDDD